MKKTFTLLMTLVAMQLSATNPHLEYVPNDTALFSGGLKPLPQKEIAQLIDFELPNGEKLPDLLGFILQTENANQTGVADEGFATLYTVGHTLVHRYQIQDVALHKSYVAALEKHTDVSYEDVEIKGSPVRVYSLNDDLFLYHKLNELEGILILETKESTEEEMEMALGLKKPEHPLEEKTLQTFAKEYGFDERSFGYVDHAKIATLIISDQKLLKDVQSLLRSFPRTVFGITTLNIPEGSLSTKYGVECKDSTICTLLKNLQGDLPDFLQNKQALVNIGIGLDVDQLLPVLIKVKERFATTQWESEGLNSIKESFDGFDPNQIAPLLETIPGLQGLSLSLFSVDEESPDALISVSSSKPEQLVEMISSLPGPLMGLEIPLDGTVVEAAIEEGETAQFALKGDHLLMFTGEKATLAADRLQKAELNKKGLNFNSFNVPALMGILEKQNQAAESPELEQALQILKYLEELTVDTSINEKGIFTELKLQLAK